MHTVPVTQYPVRSPDGTVLAAWRNDAAGIPLLICNGLASSPAAWPSLQDPDCGFDARTWWHRGIPPSEVDRYVVNPGQATAYKIGMIRIQELRKKAEAELGSGFDIRGFHDAVLGGGAMPLDLLERRVDQWISAQKGAKKAA